MGLCGRRSLLVRPFCMPAHDQCCRLLQRVCRGLTLKELRNAGREQSPITLDKLPPCSSSERRLVA